MKIKLLTGIGIFILCASGMRSSGASPSDIESTVFARLQVLQQDTTKKDTTKKVTPSPQTKPAAPVSQPSAAQDTTKNGLATGIVVDENAQPIPGVGVKSASGKGTVTDAAGKFSIPVTGPAENLTFSYIGYAPITRPAGASNIPLSIKMVPAAGETLKNVTIVGVGYGTLDKKEVTSAVAHVDTAEFRQSGARSPLDLIQGKVAGLNLTRTGGSNPNSSPSVQLRGVVSVTGSASPLYVIDGIPGGNPDLLQQDDILSVDVLKDGSGAAIYGTSANAGVILITTKKGKPGAPTLNYSSYVRKEFIQNRLDFLNAAEFRDKIASGQIQAIDNGGNDDRYDRLVNHDNLSQNHNLSLSGGSEQTSYRASINYRDLQGIALENGREEYTARINVNQKALDNKLNLQMNLASNFNKANLLSNAAFSSFYNNELSASGWEEEATRNPTIPLFNADGSYNFEDQGTNQYARLFQNTNYRKQQTSSADFKADLDIVKGLKGTVFGSVQ